MASIPLLIADASEILLGGLVQPSWGIFDQKTSQPVILPASFLQNALVSQIQPLVGLANTIASIASQAGLPTAGIILPASASTVEFEYRQDWPISTYPQENGAFQAYDKVTLPYDIRVRLASSGAASTRQNFINTCLAIAASFDLFNIQTPERWFYGVNCTHIDWRKTARQGVTLITVDMHFIQVPVVSSTNFLNTQSPTDSGQQALGNTQPTSLTPSQQSAYSGATINP